MGKENKMNYIIETKTAEGRKKSSTDANIYIKMVNEGATEATEWILLDNWLRDDFEEGRWDTFNITTHNVQIPKSIGLKIEKKDHSDAWFCERVIVKSPTLSKSVEFLVFDWLITELWSVAGEETISQKETCRFIKDVRKREVERNKNTFRWLPRPCPNRLGWGMPRFCNAETVEELPYLFHNSDQQVFSFEGTRALVRSQTLKEYLSGKLGFGSSLKDFDDYLDVLKGTDIPVDRPNYYERWQMDEEFGRSALNGTNPLTLERINKMPSGILFDAEKLDQILDEDMTLEKAFEMNRMYAIDYRHIVRELPRNIRTKSRAQLHAADPVVILYVKNNGALVPILIQLADDDHEKVFTPQDTHEDWLLAKMYFKSVDVAIHEWISHYLNTHAIMEPFAVALFRNLSSRHPIYKLMRPHLRTVAAINTMARKDLLGPDSAANQCIGIGAGGAAVRSFSNFHYDDLNIPKVLMKKGIADREALPNYHYRDDATELWKVISDYVQRIISIYYENDQEVMEDEELQNWAYDVAVEGVGWQNGDLKGFPKELATKEELQSYITVVMYTCSVQHAAINFGQFEVYKVLPFSPGAMRLPPHKRGEATMERIMNSLPDAVMTVLQLGTSYLLSKYSAEDVFLGNYAENMFSNGGVWLAQEKFRRDLRKVEERIIKRNEKLEIPYTTLRPSRIPISIAS